MANRRMIAKDVIRSDAFLDLPFSSQALYYQFSIDADDDGFVNNCNSIKRLIGASDDDIKTLIDNNFIIAFDSGMIVICHWKINNQIQKDRYKPTAYNEEKAKISLNTNKVYVECIQNVSNLDTQYSIDKDSIAKNNSDKLNLDEDRRVQGSVRGQQSTADMDNDTFRSYFNNKTTT